MSRLKIIVAGMVAGNPGQGGAAWAVLQYVLGLLHLGHDVYLVEPMTRSQLLPDGATLQASANAAYFIEVARNFGLQSRSSLLLQETTDTVGLSYSDLRTAAATANVLLNISGMLKDDFIQNIPCRMYVDLDPAFNQLWQACEGIDMRLAAHNFFVTVGNAIGRPSCSIPTCGVLWTTTFQPVVLDYWTVRETITYDALTTIANWRGYGSIERAGVLYGQKAHSLRAFIDLPLRTREKFMLALAIHADEKRDLDKLRNNNWTLLDPARVAGTPQQYQTFVQGSKAEFGIAKSGYVASRCAWFSDRSACYLASGRPVIAQETGFSAFLPTGEGVFAFDTHDDILHAIEAINADYRRQAKAARSLAVEFFDSNIVLPKLLRAIGVI